MKRFLLCFAFSILASGVFAAGADSFVLFPRDDFDVKKAVQSKGVDVQFEDGALTCRQVTTGDWPHFIFETKWNAVQYPHLVVDAENTCGELVRVYLRFLPQRPDGRIDSQPFVDIEAKTKVSRDILFQVKDSTLRPEVIKKLNGIRGYPGDTKRRNRPPKVVEATDALSGTVDRIVFGMYQNGKPRSFKITKIEAKKTMPSTEGGKVEAPAFANMTDDEFFPFIDKYGQFMHAEWPGKTHSDADLRKSYEKEIEDLDSHPGPKGWNKYGGWADGPKQEATGHFYAKKIDGMWWLVDPDGSLWWSHGPVRVTPSSAVTPLEGREYFFAELPKPESEFGKFYETNDRSLYLYYVKRNQKKTYDFSAANLLRKYGKEWRDIYADMAHRRLRSWGMNTIGNCSDWDICLRDKTPYIERFELKSPWLEGSRDGWWKFNDPFHPEFRTNFCKQLAERKNQLDDPWCFGYFVDNEIAWGGPADLGKWTLQSPATQAAKVEFVHRLKEQYGEIVKLNDAWKSNYASWDALQESTMKPPAGAEADCRVFSEAIAEAYYKNIRDEFKAVAPNKLYMGCRFAGNHAAFMHIAAKYCDVISYNIYSKSLADFKLPDGIDKPVIIGEFHFGALDRGLFHPTLVQVKDQAERGQAYYDYVESALKHPNFIGVHWHQYADQATTGRFDGENFQNGFLDVCDHPYPETIAKAREIGYKMYEVRSKAGKRVND